MMVSYSSVTPPLFLLIIVTMSFEVVKSSSASPMDEDSTGEATEAYPQSWVIANTCTAVLLFFTSLTAFVCLAAIVASSSTRSKSFNVYTIFLILPDAILTGIACCCLWYEVTHEGRYVRGLCLLRNGTSFFYYSANLYLNAVVGYHVYQLVKKSHQRIRTKPPSLRAAYTQVGVTYVGSIVVAIWSLGGWTWSPYTLYDDTYCHTRLGSSSISKWTSAAIACCTVGPPVVYVSLVYFQIWHQELLPPSGKTRVIFLYFFRILIVYFAFYVPNSFMGVAYMFVDIPEVKFWLLWSFSTLVAFQCAFTVYLMLTKEDVCEAVYRSLARLAQCLRLPVCMIPSSIRDSAFLDSAATPASVPALRTCEKFESKRAGSKLRDTVPSSQD